MTARDPNRNALWARAIAEELERSGVAAAVVSPGSRSAPVAFALRGSRIRLYTAHDERGGGYFALGLARAARAPVALLATSGTAAANYLPAVVEAQRSRVPLVVLTADRPHELRDTGANQTIDQVHIYGRNVRLHRDVGPPEAADGPVRALRALVCRAVAAASEPPAAPVHLNLQLRKPLEPTPVPGDVPAGLSPLALEGRPDKRAYVEAPAPQAAAPTAAETEAGARLVLRSRRGVLVAGPRNPDPALAAGVFALARATGFPLLADPLSGLRFEEDAAGVALSGYDALFAAGFDPGAPDLVLRVGAPPTSAALERWIERHAADAANVVVDDASSWSDPAHVAATRVVADPGPWCGAVAGALPAPPADARWTARFRDAEAVAWKAAEAAFDGPFFEGVVAAEVAASVPSGGVLHVSSSLPVRDVDRFVATRTDAVLAVSNRGASGVDGVLASGLGAAATGRRTTILLGDVALLHDLGSLALARHAPDARVVVVNNDGGGIFRLLPAAAHEPAFTELLVAPHGRTFEHAAAFADLPYALAEDRASLRRALAGPARLVEVRSDGAANARLRLAATKALAGALEGGLPRT